MSLLKKERHLFLCTPIATPDIENAMSDVVRIMSDIERIMSDIEGGVVSDGNLTGSAMLGRSVKIIGTS